MSDETLRQKYDDYLKSSYNESFSYYNQKTGSGQNTYKSSNNFYTSHEARKHYYSRKPPKKPNEYFEGEGGDGFLINNLRIFINKF